MALRAGHFLLQPSSANLVSAEAGIMIRLCRSCTLTLAVLAMIMLGVIAPVGLASPIQEPRSKGVVSPQAQSRYEPPAPPEGVRTFAAGAIELAYCRMRFLAYNGPRGPGGFVIEECNFGGGIDYFAGHVECFAARVNIATFVWLFDNATYNQGLHQRVWVVDNGDLRSTPDQFFNSPESLSNPCPVVATPPPGATHSILGGNIIVRSDS